MKMFGYSLRAAALALALITTIAQPLDAQDDARSCLQAGRKSLKAARALEAEERVAMQEEALVLFRSVGSRWPDALEERAQALIEAGRLLQRLGRTDEALASYREVASFNAGAARRVEALAAAASLHRRRKDPAAATACLEEIVQGYPQENKAVAEALLDLGALARDADRFATAVKLARRVLDEHPGLWRQNVDACQLWLGVLVRCHQWDEARNRLERLDALMKERFESTKSWESVQRWMSRLSARKSLTPVPVVDPS